MGKQGISIKGSMDHASVVAFLEDVVKSFKDKTVCVQRGDEFVTLTPADSIELEIEAVVKKGKQKLSIELNWREEITIESADTPFKVSSVEPEPKPVEEPVEEVAEKVEEVKEAVKEEAKRQGEEAAEKLKEKTAVIVKQAEEGLGTPDKAAKAPAKGAKK